MKATRKNIRISPKKVNIVAGLVRSKRVPEALATLKLMNKKAAIEIYKTIKAASAGAVHNFSQEEERLRITRLLVLTGPTYKRIQAVSRGRAHRILKKTTHIHVEVGI